MALYLSQMHRHMTKASFINVISIYITLFQLKLMFVCSILFFMSLQQSFSYVGRVFLGCTSTKLGLMCLAKGHNTVTPVWEACTNTCKPLEIWSHLLSTVPLSSILYPAVLYSYLALAQDSCHSVYHTIIRNNLIRGIPPILTCNHFHPMHDVRISRELSTL